MPELLFEVGCEELPAGSVAQAAEQLAGTVSRRLDEACGPQIRLENEPAAIRYALSQSFGFGGSNCVLAFGGELPA